MKILLLTPSEASYLATYLQAGIDTIESNPDDPIMQALRPVIGSILEKLAVSNREGRSCSR